MIWSSSGSAGMFSSLSSLWVSIAIAIAEARSPLVSSRISCLVFIVR